MSDNQDGNTCTLHNHFIYRILIAASYRNRNMKWDQCQMNPVGNTLPYIHASVSKELNC